MRPAIALALVGLVLPACYTPGGDKSPGQTTAAQPNQPAPCPQPDTGPRVRWHKRFRSAAAAGLSGDPHHSTNDPIINPGQNAVIRGKFAYGVVSKDLEGEDVALWLRMRPCGGWKEIARAVTDSDGRATLNVARTYLSGPGAYPYQLIVRGDLSRAYGTIYVLERDTRVMIFDIDGTLTTGDGEIVEQVALGSDPDMHPGANLVVEHHVRAGYLPIYITGRPYILRGATASWLHRRGFPPGPLITTDRFTDSRPGHDYVGRFKYFALRALRDDIGLTIDGAYGNADSDVCAYSRIGITPTRIFIVSPSAKRCEQHPPTQSLTNYVEHLGSLQSQAVR